MRKSRLAPRPYFLGQVSFEVQGWHARKVLRGAVAIMVFPLAWPGYGMSGSGSQYLTSQPFNSGERMIHSF